MSCSLDHTRALFRKKNLINRFDQLTEDTGAKVSEFNQIAYQVKELAIAKYGPLPEGALRPIKLDGRKAIFNPIFFEWVDRKNAEQQSDYTGKKIKPGVIELFQQFPELSRIGTPEQYSEYLDTIFPNSKLKEIVYHVTNEEFDDFDLSKTVTNEKDFGKAYYFTFDYFVGDWKEYRDTYTPGRYDSSGEDLKGEAFSIPYFVNLKSPEYLGYADLIERESERRELGLEGSSLDFIKKNHDGIIDHDANQIVLFEKTYFKLGSDKDVEGFKKFIKNSLLKSEFSSIFYQLTDTTKLEKNDVELDTFLMEFLKPFGVKAEELEDYKVRFGRDSLGVTDVLNKLIYYSANRNIETVPEEFGHMLSILMGPEHPVMKELLNEITNWEEYAQVYKDYYAKYDYNANKVKLEALGKLIAKRLVAKYREAKAPKNKLEKLIDQLIEFIMKPLRNIYKSGYYSKFLADKIAVQVLAGNKDFVHEGYKGRLADTQTFEAVNFEQSLKDNKLASYIVKNYGYKFGNPLVGSLAIAGQNEVILRAPNEPVHDLDFIVQNEDKYNAVVAKLIKDNAQPIHFGWSNTNKSYTTYSFFIPLDGHTVEVVERNSSGWAVKDAQGNFKIVVKNANGKVVPASPQNVIPVDFFVYPNNAPFNENIIDNKFSSWQDIFRGKASLSPLGDLEVLFQREKDQVDYVLNNPVSRALKPNPIFMFYQLDSDKNTIDPTSTPEKSKLEELYLKQLKSLKNRLQELLAIRGRESRLEVSNRIKVIKNSIEELESSTSIAKLFNVAFWDITAAKKILSKSDKDTTAFDMNELVRILSALEGFDIAMADIITSPEEKKYVIAIRNAVAEMTPKFNKKLSKVVEGIAKGEGYDYTYAQITKAVEDLGRASSLLYSPEESHIPILRVAASVLNQFEADVRDEKTAFNRKYEELKTKYKNFDYSTILENGHLVLPYREEYYEEEAKHHASIAEVRLEIQELYNKAAAEGKPVNKIRVQGLYQRKKALELLKFDWYKNNNDYYLTPEMEEEYNNDYKAKKDSLTDPLTGEVDQEELDKFEKEHSPFQNAAGKLTTEVVNVNGRGMRKFNVISDFAPSGRWYRYLTMVPKTEGKVNWSNPKYEQVKDNEVYKFIVETFTEGISRVPHDLYSETAGPHKILRRLMFDATNNTFSFNTWGKDALDTVKNWYSLELTSTDIEERYKGITDYAGREKATIKAPVLQKMQGAENPLELANRFFELAVEYDNATKVAPVTDLLQYQLSQMDALRINTITGKMYKTIVDGSKIEPEVVKQGLINAQKSLRYKTDSVLSKKTRLDEEKITITEEERKDLADREKKWVEGGMIGPRPTLRKTSHVVIFDAVTDYTRLNLIGLKPFTAAANVIMGMSSNYLYAARNKEFNDKHLWKATNVLLQSLFKATYKSQIASKDAIKLTLLAEKFNIVTNLFEGQDRGSTAISKAVNKLMYLMQERGEYSIHTQLMLAMMYAQKVTDTSGKENNLWDAFVLEKDASGNNFLAWNEKKFGPQEIWQSRQVLDASGLNISKLKQFEESLRRVRIATQGDYQNALLGKAQWYGRTSFLFRTWLPSAIRQRFGEEIDGEFKGRYRTWSQYAKASYRKGGLTSVMGSSLRTAGTVLARAFFVGPLSVLGMDQLSKITNENYEKSLKSLGLSDLDIENMRVNIRELQLIVFLAIIAGALKQLADDDDDPELNFLINLAQRVHQDLTFFMDPSSAMAVIKDPIPIYKTVIDAIDVKRALMVKLENPEKDIYARGRRKGESKLSKELIDLFPGWSGFRSTIGITQQQFESESYKYNQSYKYK